MHFQGEMINFFLQKRGTRSESVKFLNNKQQFAKLPNLTKVKNC